MCSCNKGQQTMPTGYGYANAAQRAQAEEERRAAQAAEAQSRLQRQPEPSLTASGAQTYSLRTPGGSVLTFGSRLEALAERERTGGVLI